MPFLTGLGVLDRIDYFVVCNNMTSIPNLVVLKPEPAKQITRTYQRDKFEHWWQPKAYNEHYLGFEHVFGGRTSEPCRLRV